MSAWATITDLLGADLAAKLIRRYGGCVSRCRACRGTIIPWLRRWGPTRRRS